MLPLNIDYATGFPPHEGIFPLLFLKNFIVVYSETILRESTQSDFQDTINAPFVFELGSSESQENCLREYMQQMNEDQLTCGELVVAMREI